MCVSCGPGASRAENDLFLRPPWIIHLHLSEKSRNGEIVIMLQLVADLSASGPLCVLRLRECDKQNGNSKKGMGTHDEPLNLQGSTRWFDREF